MAETVQLCRKVLYSHRLNRKFVRTDDTTQDSEETATAFTVSQSIAITREQSFSLQIHE